MRIMRKPVVAGLMAAAAFGVAQSAGAGGEAREYVVLYEHEVRCRFAMDGEHGRRLTDSLDLARLDNQGVRSEHLKVAPRPR